jgi:hypothetical protein
VKIARIDHRLVRVPLTETIAWGSGTRSATTRLLCRIETEDGTIGWGETLCLLDAIPAVFERVVSTIGLGYDVHAVERLRIIVVGAPAAAGNDRAIEPVAGAVPKYPHQQPTSATSPGRSRMTAATPFRRRCRIPVLGHSGCFGPPEWIERCERRPRSRLVGFRRAGATLGSVRVRPRWQFLFVLCDRCRTSRADWVHRKSGSRALTKALRSDADHRKIDASEASVRHKRNDVQNGLYSGDATACPWS